jgi:hypothetical protein
MAVLYRDLLWFSNPQVDIEVALYSIRASPPQGARKQTGITTTQIPSYGICHNPVLKFGFAKLGKSRCFYLIWSDVCLA